LQQLTCKIRSVDHCNADTRRVLLEIPAGASFNFKAGQYLNIVVAGKPCPFSIASSPEIKDTIELHVRPTPGSADSVEIEKLLDSADQLHITYPMGECYIDTPIAGPLVLMAASTGITQMKSIIEFLIPRDTHQPIWLYWGVVAAQDLYLTDMCRAWQAKIKNFTFVPVVSEPLRSPQWSGRTGLLPDAVLEDFNDLAGVEVYVSGSPGMVYATFDRFIQRGLAESMISSDVFFYAPRVKPQT
jgi:CDP-4-dehydro-6-deoxyglucose reductase, E3